MENVCEGRNRSLAPTKHRHQNLISKLQSDALNADIPVVHLLRTAKIVATKLEFTDELVCIDREPTGYMDLKVEDLPPYRRLPGEPKAWNRSTSKTRSTRAITHRRRSGRR